MPNPSAAAVESSLCPLCSQPNRCAMELERETGTPQGPCWCTGMDFSDSLLAQVPAALKDRACICSSCARSAARV